MYICLQRKEMRFDVDRIAAEFMGPEAMNLITALKEFVSAVTGRTVREHEVHRKIRIEKNDRKGLYILAFLLK